MDFVQRTIPVPQAEVAIDRAARGQVLADVAPLAAGAQHIHEAVDHLAHLHRALPATTLGRWDQWLDQQPLVIGQIAWIAELVAVVAMAVLDRPDRGTS